MDVDELAERIEARIVVAADMLERGGFETLVPDGRGYLLAVAGSEGQSSPVLLLRDVARLAAVEALDFAAIDTRQR